MYPQVTVNVPVRKTTSLENVPDVAAVIAEVERRLVGQEGQLLVRYSGTEPLLRITLQGSDQGDIERWAEEIAEVVRRRLG